MEEDNIELDFGKIPKHLQNEYARLVKNLALEFFNNPEIQEEYRKWKEKKEMIKNGE